MDTTRSRNPAGHAGLFNNVLAMVGSLAGFVECRAALFARESKGALAQLLIVLGCIVAAILFLTLGYLFLIGTAVVAIARATATSWLYIALGAAALHFVFAIVALLIARAKAAQAPFREFAEELKKDREWLKNLDQTSRLTR